MDAAQEDEDREMVMAEDVAVVKADHRAASWAARKESVDTNTRGHTVSRRDTHGLC